MENITNTPGPHPSLDRMSDAIAATAASGICPECGDTGVEIHEWAYRCGPCVDILADAIGEMA